MIQFVWVIIKDTPVTGMRFIKISDQEERERLEKFYGWLTGPITQFSDKVQDLIIENTKYYYHSRNEALFVVGTDLDEKGIPMIFIPELVDLFFSQYSNADVAAFDGKDISKFRKFDKIVFNLVKAFNDRKSDIGKRKDLDAFEVLNLPNELQMVALVLVKMKVVTPDMVSQVSGLTSQEVERQLREIYQRGYLYITSISEKSYFSVKPFGSEESPRMLLKREEILSADFDEETDIISQEESPIVEQKQAINVDEVFPPIQEKSTKFSLDAAQIIEEGSSDSTEKIETAMMAPPGWMEDEISPIESQKIPQPSEEATIKKVDKKTKLPSTQKEPRGIKFKDDPIAQEIDSKHALTIAIGKNGHLPSNSLRREKGFNTGRIRIPNERNKDAFLFHKMIKKDLEVIFEALFMGDMLVFTSNRTINELEDLIGKIFDTANLLTPHRNLKCLVSETFVHPKDADVIFVPRKLLKYYSWATIVDIDQNKVLGGNATDFAKSFLKKTRKIDDSKEFLKEVTQTSSILVKVGKDINTLKIEGRSPDLYLTEVRKTFGATTLEAGLALSERLIRLHKDCAYIAGYYIRKALDIAVNAIILGKPLVVFGDDPLNVYHVIASLSIFAPHKALNSQIWTTNLAGINIEKFDIIGAQEGTDKLFKDAIKVNLRTMNAYGSPRSEFIRNFLRQMWKRRSKDRPKFIRENINRIFSDSEKVLEEINTIPLKEVNKQKVKEIFANYPEAFNNFIADLIEQGQPELADKLRT